MIIETHAKNGSNMCGSLGNPFKEEKVQNFKVRLPPKVKREKIGFKDLHFCANVLGREITKKKKDSKND